jgi:hypothetical protein
MKLQALMFCALIGCFAASTAVNFQLLDLLRNARIEVQPSSATPDASELQPFLDQEAIDCLETLTLTKEQCEMIRDCSMT